VKAHLVAIEFPIVCGQTQTADCGAELKPRRGHKFMRPFIGDLRAGHEGQDITEYAVLLAGSRHRAAYRIHVDGE
jgi:hypothetical protein